MPKDGRKYHVQPPMVQTPMTAAVDDKHLLEVLSPSFRKIIEAVPEEYWDKDADQLDKELFLQYGKHTEAFAREKKRHIRIRHQLWKDIERSRKEKRVVSPTNVCRGTFAESKFHHWLSQKPVRVAWLMMPPPEHDSSLAPLLERGLDRIWDILNMPIKEKKCRCHHLCVCNRSIGAKKGQPDAVDRCVCMEECVCPPTYNFKTAEVIRKTYEMVEMRQKGAIIQRQQVDKRLLKVEIEKQKSEFAETEASNAKDVVEIKKDLSLLEIDAKLREVAQKAEQMDRDVLSGTIDVTDTQSQPTNEQQEPKDTKA